MSAPQLSQHRLADGAQLVLGMRVVDYDRKHGVLIDDSGEKYPQNAVELSKRHVPGSSSTCEAWFYVLRDDGTKSSFDCSRMIAEGGRLDR